MKQRYTPEEIWYEYGEGIRWAQVLPDAFRTLVSLALSKVPCEVADHTLDRCWLVLAESESQGQEIPAEAVAGKDILVFPPDLLERPPEEAQRTIVHEIAHSYLGHRLAAHLTPDEFEKQEDEACAKVDEWLAHLQREGEEHEGQDNQRG